MKKSANQINTGLTLNAMPNCAVRLMALVNLITVNYSPRPRGESLL